MKAYRHRRYEEKMAENLKKKISMKENINGLIKNGAASS